MISEREPVPRLNNLTGQTAMLQQTSLQNKQRILSDQLLLHILSEPKEGPKPELGALC